MGFAEHIAAVDRATHAHLGGVAVTYAPESGLPVSVTGLFDENYVLSDPGQAGLELVVPAVSLRIEDLPLHPRDDNPTLTIEGVDYTVRERPTDGIGGIIRLILRRSGI